MEYFFDIIGIAVTTAKEMPFHAMAANKVEEAKYAIKLVKNASQVSNFCNDVIGDISGIISGSLGATIIFKLANIYDLKKCQYFKYNNYFPNSLFYSWGGKAFGKSVAIMNSEKKSFFKLQGYLIFLEKKLGIDILPDKKKKNSR